MDGNDYLTTKYKNTAALVEHVDEVMKNPLEHPNETLTNIQLILMFQQALNTKGLDEIVDDVLTKNVPQTNTTYDQSIDKVETNVNNVKLPDGTWDKGPFQRGKDIDEFMENNTGSNYPVIDKFDDVTGKITSVKSRDLTGVTYQNGSQLYNTIKQDIDKLVDFTGHA